MYTQPHYVQQTSPYPPSTSYNGGYGNYQQQPPQQYYAPPPPDPYTMSPDAFRAWFSSQLQQLVVNQKNIIHKIAYIANEHAQRMAPVMAQCMEQHIRRANPQIKLPAWYLVDSISKNIGRPYTQIFPQFIVSLFLDSYHAVDVNTRAKMEEMLVTWRTGGPGGQELFGVDAQTNIERSVWGGASTSSRRNAGPSKAQVITELDVVMAQKVRALEINPFDEVSKGHVETLDQLRTIVQTTSLSPEELNDILTQLRNLARIAASSAPPLPAIPPPQAYPAAPQSYPNPPVRAPETYPPVAPASVSLAPAPSAPAPVSVPSVPGMADLSSLFNNLVKAGVVSSAAIPAPSTSSSSTIPSLSALSALLASTPATTPENKVTSVTDSSLDAEKEYERLVLSLDGSLNGANLQREQPQVISLLYDQLSLQCKQCALRFPDDGGKGKKRFEDHLDLHFRQNLRSATAANSTSGVGVMGRGYTRSWFVGKKDWVHDIAEGSHGQNSTSSANEKGKGRASSPSASKQSVEERLAKLKASFVVIPPGEETKTILCVICKEHIKPEFSDDDEEWIWRNATSVRGKIYHATCHADAVTASVTARLRSDVNGPPVRSRSITPDAPTVPKSESASMRNSPSLAGSKRKVEDLDEATARSVSQSLQALSHLIKPEGADASRPLKKVALS
ncbi:hypothetical protein FRC03_001694 [Tulasnella sp. 419]|nr:hypothetical protein FRC03_001694 [Tulasnella sp. 419]